MKTYYKSIFLWLPVLALLVIYPVQESISPIASSPTPTYDPLVEPPLPEDPTELELGRNLYWHWCMPCHGDRGQGLTDEFRAIWEPDHQNCWERGCHGGQGMDEGFPIPTIVPGIMNKSYLAHFAAVQELSGFLEKTHPPQSPGILESREYQAVALFVFTMNERLPVDSPVMNTPASTFTVTSIPNREAVNNSFPTFAIVIFAILMLGLFTLSKRDDLQK